MLAPIVTRPETIASCDMRTRVHPGRVLDGVKIEHDTVEFLVPCLDKPELTKLLGEYLADQKPQIKGKAAQGSSCARNQQRPSQE